MLDSWQAEKLTVYRNQRAGPFNLVASTQTYTIGDGATWDVNRPIWINNAGWLDNSLSPALELPMRVFTDEEWAKIRIKTITSTIPTGLWYDFTYPNGTIYTYPIPTVARQVVLYIPIPLTSGVELADDISLPPGYREFMKYHLAIRLCPAFGKTPSQTTLAMASAAMERVKNANIRMSTLAVDPELSNGSGGGIYNWLSDSFLGRF